MSKDPNILEVRDRVREVVAEMKEKGMSVRLQGVIAAEAAPRIWERRSNINPHTGLPNRGPKGKAGSKIAKKIEQRNFTKGC